MSTDLSKALLLPFLCSVLLAQPNANYATVSTALINNIAANVVTMQNSDTCLEAASVNTAHGYNNCFNWDLWLLLERYPSGLTPAQVRALLLDFYAIKATDQATGHLTGDIPYNINPATMTTNPAVNGACLGFPNGNDPACNHTQGDAVLHVFLPYLAWKQDGDTTFLAAHIDTIEMVMDNMYTQHDASGAIVSNAGSEWTPDAFLDMVFFQGQHLSGTLFYYWGCIRLAIIETVLGRPTKASKYLDRAKLIKTFISDPACPLWDAGNGMFLASTVTNAQISIFGSGLATYLNVASSTQQSATSAYLVANASALECTTDAGTPISPNGFLRESPSNWGTVKPSWAGQTTGQHYQNGWSSWGLDWVWTAMEITSLANAVTQAIHFATGVDLTREQFGTALNQCAGGCYNGTTGNLESPAGAYGWMTGHRSSFPDGGGSAPTITSFTASISGNVVTLTWATAGSATYLYIDQGIGIVSGTSGSTIHLPVTWGTTYTLTAANAFGNVTAQVTATPPSSITSGSAVLSGKTVIQ